MTLFRLDASILPASSARRSLADLVEAEWTASHPDSTVVRRDLAADPVPANAWADAVTGGFVDEAQRTDGQRAARALATSFADELIDADALLFAVPLYNYGVSQHFKTWFDLAYTDPRIDPQGTALRGKPATLVTRLARFLDDPKLYDQMVSTVAMTTSTVPHSRVSRKPNNMPS